MRHSEAALRAWMTAGMDGDAAAHAALLRALVPLLRGFFRRRMGGDEDIEDLVQETLIAIHTKRGTYDRDRPFTAWMYAIARYRLIDHLRRRRVALPIEEIEAILMIEGFEDALTARLDVDRLLAGLPGKQARAIRDTHIDGLSVAEAADGARIGHSDVKVSVHRGLKALAARLRGES
ncbi:sigma-70 family RNA polymerase sigma factor [Sphingomonas sp. RS6]